MSYAELFAISNFTFLTGASHAEELAARAAELGLGALAITDKNSFAGIVRGHAAAKTHGLRYVVGVQLVLTDGAQVLAYPKNRTAYGRLCRLLTAGKRRAVKGQCAITFTDLLKWGAGSLLILLNPPTQKDSEQETEADETTSARTLSRAPSGDGENPLTLGNFTDFAHFVGRLKSAFGDDVFLALQPAYDGADELHFAARAALAEKTGLELVSVGGVLMHHAQRRPLADILSCLREKKTIDTLGLSALPNAERRLKSEFEMRRLFAAYPQAARNTMRIAQACDFSLDELKYEYPDEITDGLTPDERLRRLTEAGLARRYPDTPPLKVRAMVEKELRLIAQLDYARYFLTVHDIVAFARGQGILCQGRGSAANSVVCYALGITEASPETISMVFERFISEVRNEPPDIDVDFEHERREEVIQHIYQKYGRHRAGICATVVHFRSRAAIREVGKAMGLSQDAIAALSSQVWGTSSRGLGAERAQAAGLDISDQRLQQTLSLAREIIGFPRHLSQHVGGFVITRGRLDELCPVENAAMDDRTIIEWDKDDIDLIGMLKIDVLSLGMLSCLRKAFDLLRDWKGEDHTLASLPPDDAGVYDMLCRADTVGVFQVESRAQMNFLPRMRPRCFYDLVIEVAIIRPGPIQGDMVHPYLKRRRREEPVEYPSEALKPVLEKTLGVPLFQEQAMQIAIVAAGFSPSEADALRRALGTFRGPGTVETFRERFIEGCLDNGYDRDFAERCFKQLEGFSGYGFPESHSASFALLVYASSWIKHHHPEVFCCALLNAQPMGFYAPAQIVRDARAHGVAVLPVCAEQSYWDNVLEPTGDGRLAVRLGFRQIKGFREEDGLWLSAARGRGFGSIDAVWRRAGLARNALTRLAGADGFAAYGLSRREALWAVKGLGGDAPLALFEHQGENLPVIDTALPELCESENVFEDYVATRLTLRRHPVALLRPQLQGFVNAKHLRNAPDGAVMRVCGLVITRQRPGTATGVIFLTLEDDTGVSNIIVWPQIFERFRKIVMAGRLLRISGKLQREGVVTHLVANHIEDASFLLDTLGLAIHEEDKIDPSRDNADEARRPIPERPASGAPSLRPHYHAPKRPEKEAITLELQRARHARYSAGARHPRQQANKLFYSRDFH